MRWESTALLRPDSKAGDAALVGTETFKRVSRGSLSSDLTNLNAGLS